MPSRELVHRPPFRRGVTLCAGLLLICLLATPAAGAQPKLALTIAAESGKSSHVWTIAADGSSLKQLTAGSAHDSAPTWSPGRGTIAFKRSRTAYADDTTAKVMLMRSDGSNQRQVSYAGPSLTTGATALAFSPDGRYLAGGCRVGDPNDWAVTLLDLKTRTSRILLPFECENGVVSVTWSPDGKRIAASIEYGGGYGTLLIDVPGARLVKEVGGYASASWRPDGKYLLCSYLRQPGTTLQTWLLRPDGTRAKRLGTEQSDPAFSPDGKHYAFAVRGKWGYPGTLKYADADGSHVRVIHPWSSKEYLGAPAWR